MGEGGEEYGEGLFTILDDTFYAVSTHCGADGTLMPDELRALDPFTGAEHWHYTISEGEGPIQLAAASHLIFLVTRNGVEAIDTQTHQRRWKWTSNYDNQRSMNYQHVLVADGLLFVLDKAGQITALDAPTGQPRWNLQTEQPIKGSFSTIADATLYLVIGHTLCAFR